MKSKCITIFILISSTLLRPVYAQEDYNDTARINRLIALSVRHMQQENQDSAYHYQELACLAAEKGNYIRGIALAQLTRARIERNLADNFPAAEAYCRLSIEMFQSINDYEHLAHATDILWHSLLSQSKYEQAKYYILEKSRSCELENDSLCIADMSVFLGNIHLQRGEFDSCFLYAARAARYSPKAPLVLLGTLYRYIGDYSTALRFYNTAFQDELKKVKNEHDCDIWTTTEIAELHAIQQQYDSAMNYYGLLDTLGMAPKDLRVFNTSMGEVLLHQEKYPEALEKFTSALPLHIQRNDRSQVTRTHLGIANCYFGLSRHTAAANHALQAIEISKVTNAKQSVMQAYSILAQTYDRMGEKQLANFYFRNYAEVKDVVAYNFLEGKLAALHYEQELEKLTQQKLIMHQNLQINTQQLSQARLTRNVLIAGIAFTVLLTGIFIRNIALSRRQLRNNLKIQRLESNRAHIEMQRKYAELEMAALRAQMNPHFIFNCLNAINHFILNNDADLASEYLTKFSRLIRLVLNGSSSKHVLLSDELLTLKTYIELEQLRFKKQLEFILNTGDIETDTVLIPPMLIQPFAENAIWHGLMLSDRPALLTITINQEKETLMCSIEDNGIGRARSQELKDKSNSYKKSMGINIIESRLKLLYSTESESPLVNIMDIYDNSGVAAGTIVTLKIPLQYIDAPVMATNSAT